MNSEEALVLVESALCQNPLYRVRLNSLQRTVFRSAWDDRSYGEIARQSGYELSYIKQTGSQLWRLLSRTFEEKVTKHNLQLVLQRQAIDRIEQHRTTQSIASVRPAEVDAALFSSWLKPEHQLVAVQPETVQFEAIQPKTVIPLQTAIPVEAVQSPEVIEPEVIEPEVIEPEVIEPEVIEPEVISLPAVESIDPLLQNQFSEIEICLPQPLQPHYDWGGATDVSHFYGREAELALLEKWIVADHCRLIGLFGMGGIGKTSLSIKLAKQLTQGNSAHFALVIWRSLRNAPPLADLIADLIQVVSKQRPKLPDSIDACCTQLLQELRRSRCLIVLDNGETVMRQGDYGGSYLPGYEDYDLFWQRLGQSEHQSTIVLTSREKPKQMATHEGKLLPVRSLRLTGLAIESGQALFNLKGDFVATATDWQQLIHHYAGNPLALKMVAPVIQELFNGQVAEFLACLQEGTSVFGDIQDLLAQQIQRLSLLERQVMDWLAIARKPMTLPQLRSNFNPAIGLGHLLEALSSLERRCLIEKTTGQLRFTLQPVVMEYMTEQLIDRVYQEINRLLARLQSQELATSSIETGADLQPTRLILHTHALIQAEAKDYVRETQVRLILKPVADRLLTLRTRSDWLPQFQQILTHIRQEWPPGYVGGNLINLMVQMGIELSSWDFSQLPIWNAYLRQVNLHRVNFAGSDLSKSAFADTFSQLLAVAFSPDGKLLATGDVNHEIHLWQVAEGKQILSCRIHEGWIWSVAFSPDGKFLASSANRAVHLWDLQTGACVQTLQGYHDRVFSVAFSPDGQLLATGSEDDAVRIWLQTGKLLHTLTGHQDEVRSVAFSPFSTIPLLASASYDQTVRLWNATTGECLQVLQTSSPQSSVAFSPDGKTIASAGITGTVTLWHQTGKAFPFLLQHPQRVRSIAFSADGKTLATAGDDATIRLWNYHSGDCDRVLSGHASWIAAIGFNADHWLASASEDQSVRLWNSQTGLCIRTLQGYSNGIWSIAFNSSATLLASGSQDRIVRLWRSTGELVGSMAGHTSWIWSIAVSPDQSTIASGSEDQTIRLWDVSTLKPLQVLNGHRDAVLGLCYGPAGDCLWSGSLDGTIKRWNLRTGDCQQTLVGHAGGIWSMALSSDGQYLVSGSQDQTLRIWETASGKVLLSLSGHQSWIRSVAISPDRQTIVSGSADGMLKIWQLNLDSPEAQANCDAACDAACERTILAHQGPVLSIVFHPDGQTIATSSTDTSIKLWNRQGTCQQTLQGHDRWVKGLAYSSDGKILASCSQDETIRLWQNGQNDTHRSLRIPRPYEGMQITGATGLTIAQKQSLQRLGAEYREGFD